MAETLFCTVNSNLSLELLGFDKSKGIVMVNEHIGSTAKDVTFSKKKAISADIKNEEDFSLNYDCFGGNSIKLTSAYFHNSDLYTQIFAQLNILPPDYYFVMHFCCSDKDLFLSISRSYDLLGFDLKNEVTCETVFSFHLNTEGVLGRINILKELEMFLRDFGMKLYHLKDVSRITKQEISQRKPVIGQFKVLDKVNYMVYLRWSSKVDSVVVYTSDFITYSKRTFQATSIELSVKIRGTVISLADSLSEDYHVLSFKSPICMLKDENNKNKGYLMYVSDSPLSGESHAYIFNSERGKRTFSIFNKNQKFRKLKVNKGKDSVPYVLMLGKRINLPL
ncbi:hypothetical protein D3C71_1208570 [compost metagenome]